MKNQQKSFLIFKRKALGICLVCPMVNPTLITRVYHFQLQKNILSSN